MNEYITVRVKLSNLYSCGQTLTSREAFIVTNQLMGSLRNLHKIGMSARRIDTDHIIVEQNKYVSAWCKSNQILDACLS